MDFPANNGPKRGHFMSVDGVFYRTIDTAYRSDAIAGSRLAGRYSSSEQPTLYLSATLEGMEAAIGTHRENRSSKQEVVEIEVVGDKIFDLRDMEACLAANIELSEALSPWQQLVAQEKQPTSWDVRDRIIDLGGKGLIDPSRKKPGLWHLVLFEWNRENAPTVRVV